MESQTVNEQSFAEDIGDILEAVGERLGSELYHVISPVLKSADSFRSRFIVGFKRGWKKAQEEGAEVPLQTQTASGNEAGELLFN